MKSLSSIVEPESQQKNTYKFLNIFFFCCITVWQTNYCYINVEIRFQIQNEVISRLKYFQHIFSFFVFGSRSIGLVELFFISHTSQRSIEFIKFHRLDFRSMGIQLYFY
jgi:hypothetical protein